MKSEPCDSLGKAQKVRASNALYHERRPPPDALYPEQEGLLAHLRAPGPHVRGCWALDLVFGKE